MSEYHPSRRRPALGTRDLYQAIEHDRAMRRVRTLAGFWLAVLAAFVLAYLCALALAGSLEFVRHLFATR
jgi:hypothetical protein